MLSVEIVIAVSSMNTECARPEGESSWATAISVEIQPGLKTISLQELSILLAASDDSDSRKSPVTIKSLEPNCGEGAANRCWF